MTKEDAIKILCDTVQRRKQHSRQIVSEAVAVLDVAPVVPAPPPAKESSDADAG